MQEVEIMRKTIFSIFAALVFCCSVFAQDARNRTMETVVQDVLAALQSDDAVWQNFQTLPALYVRVRIDNIQNIRKRDPEAFQRRLQKFIDNTRNGIMYGEWHDNGRLL